MAERTIVVCDVCGKPATETATIKTSRGNFAKDLCAQHVAELTAGARKPRPGRPRKMTEGTPATTRRGRPSSTAGAAASGRRKTGRKKPTRRTGRRATPRKAQSSAGAASS
jgi:hypothetical protein